MLRKLKTLQLGEILYIDLKQTSRDAILESAETLGDVLLSFPCIFHAKPTLKSRLGPQNPWKHHLVPTFCVCLASGSVKRKKITRKQFPAIWTHNKKPQFINELGLVTHDGCIYLAICRLNILFYTRNNSYFIGSVVFTSPFGFVTRQHLRQTSQVLWEGSTVTSPFSTFQINAGAQLDIFYFKSLLTQSKRVAFEVNIHLLCMLIKW